MKFLETNRHNQIILLRAAFVQNTFENFAVDIDKETM